MPGMGPARIHEMVAQRGNRCAKNRHLPLPLVRGNPKSGSGRLPTSLHVRIMANRLRRMYRCMRKHTVRWCEYGGRKGKHPLHKHSIDLMGHRWATKETQNETLVGVVVQSSRLKRSDDADKKQRTQSKKHKWNVLRLRRTSSLFDESLYAMIESGPMGHSKNCYRQFEASAVHGRLSSSLYRRGNAVCRWTSEILRGSTNHRR